MSLSPAVLDAMLAAGCTAEQIVAAVKAADAETDERREAKRANNAERQARHRAKRIAAREQVEDGMDNASNALLGVTNCDNVTDPSLSLPPNEINSNPPTHTHPDNTSRPRKADVFPKPDWAETGVWGDFLLNRKRKRLPNTASAHRRFLADIEKYACPEWPPPRLLEYATGKGWGAIYEPDEMKGTNNGRQLQPTNGFSGSVRGARPNPALDMVLQAEREQQAEAERENQGSDWPSWPALPSG